MRKNKAKEIFCDETGMNEICRIGSRSLIRFHCWLDLNRLQYFNYGSEYFKQVNITKLLSYKSLLCAE